MSTGYGWEGIKQVRATLLGARHVPQRLCGARAVPKKGLYSTSLRGSDSSRSWTQLSYHTFFEWHHHVDESVGK